VEGRGRCDADVEDKEEGKKRIARTTKRSAHHDYDYRNEIRRRSKDEKEDRKEQKQIGETEGSKANAKKARLNSSFAPALYPVAF